MLDGLVTCWGEAASGGDCADVEKELHDIEDSLDELKTIQIYSQFGVQVRIE